VWFRGGGQRTLFLDCVARVTVAAVHHRGHGKVQGRRGLREHCVVEGRLVRVHRAPHTRRFPVVTRPLGIEQVLRHVADLVRQHVLLHVALRMVKVDINAFLRPKFM
jgi:hypothetical protein